MLKALFLLGLLGFWSAGSCAEEKTEALLVVTSDQHSSYERTAQFVARVKHLRAEHPYVPMAVLINGDTFEAGNVVAERSRGAIEYAMFTALARCAPTFLNVGNHEPEFAGLAETIDKIQETGVVVLTTAIDASSGLPFASATHLLHLGKHELALVGLATPHLATYRAEVRSSLQVPDPVDWAMKEFPRFLIHTELPVVMAHTGLTTDRRLFPLLPAGTLLIGGHDHLQLVERQDKFVYLQSGSWNECVSVARLRVGSHGASWEIEQVPLTSSAPADPEIASLIKQTMDRYLTPAERETVGTTASELSPNAAATFVVEAVRQATMADAAIVGATTFGAGLPHGSVSRYALNACVRFDSTIFVGEIDGAQLDQLLARTNQGPSTPFAERQGEKIISAAKSSRFEAGRVYRFATVDWIVKNQDRYLPNLRTTWVEHPDLKLKAIAIQALNRETNIRAETNKARPHAP